MNFILHLNPKKTIYCYNTQYMLKLVVAKHIQALGLNGNFVQSPYVQMVHITYCRMSLGVFEKPDRNIMLNILVDIMIKFHAYK